VRVGYLGPPGTFSDEALQRAGDYNGVGFAAIADVIAAVQAAEVERGLVPLENALEGSVDATLDALVADGEDVHIVGELVHPVRLCLVAREERELTGIATVASFPHAGGQCRRFLRREMPAARVLPAASTAEAVRSVTEAGGPDAALGTRAAAALYGAAVLREGVDDVTGNETRFAWIARETGPPRGEGPWKTSIVFWGAGSEASGWLVGCLSEFAFRGVNLVRIESRPRRQSLGRYMFFVDLEGAEADPAVADALAALADRTERVRVLGSYPAASPA
jgi:prephenate dehydratase